MKKRLIAILKAKLTHNLGLKILSLILAVFTWLIMVNVSNPLITVTQMVPVEFVNEDVLTNAGLTYEPVGRNTVTVSYRVHVRDEARISASDFYAYADLAQLYDVTGSIPVQVDISSYTGRSMIAAGSVEPTPAVVRIQTEPLQTKAFTLEPHIIGETPSGYVIGDVSFSPMRIYATGAQSVIGQISSAGVEIVISDFDVEHNTDLTGEAAVRLYDANGTVLNLEDEVQIDNTSIKYTISVLRARDLTLDFQVSGSVATGYRFTGVDSDVRSISVVGRRSAVDVLTTLRIDKGLDISGATKDVVVTVDLNDYLPDNISIAGGTQTTATVTMRVEPLRTRQFEYSTSDIQVIGLPENCRYEFWDDSVMLSIRGLEEDLDLLTTDQIRVTANLEGLEPGMNQVNLSVNLDQEFESVATVTASVQIIDLSTISEGPGAAQNPSEGKKTDTSGNPRSEDTANP